MSQVAISIVIVNFNTQAYLRTCLQSIEAKVLSGAEAMQAVEVIVVDNASQDGSVEMVKEAFPFVKLIASTENLGFGKANNLAISQALGTYIFLLNSDAYLLSNTPKRLLEVAISSTNIVCVAPRVLLADEYTLQAKAFGYLPNLKTVAMQSLGLNVACAQFDWARGVNGVSRHQQKMEVGWVSGVCMLFRQADYLSVGGFDERFFMYCEDIHLCMKLSKLGSIVLFDDAPIVHVGGGSTKGVNATVNNSLLQQQHLCIIMRESMGGLKTHIAKWVMALGLAGRCMLALLAIPKQGISANTLLQTSLARLLKLPQH